MKHAQPHCTYTPLIALSLSLLLAACGGADNSSSSAARTENASNTPITVTGADQASVSYQPYGDRQTAATIRVAETAPERRRWGSITRQ
jgi:ABC-type glycerol-3-phosphate transport system substrate-binding protein